jgi:hypothetical protein
MYFKHNVMSCTIIMSCNCTEIPDSIIAGLSYVSSKLIQRSCFINLTTSSLDTKKLH